jgi:hypothetical protein
VEMVGVVMGIVVMRGVLGVLIGAVTGMGGALVTGMGLMTGRRVRGDDSNVGCSWCWVCMLCLVHVVFQAVAVP